MRLDKFLSQRLEVSRAVASRMLRAKLVKVNNDIVRDGAFHLMPEHQVCCEDVLLHQVVGPRYFMMHKPKGYVCSHQDPVHSTVFSLINEPLKNKLNPVGRLDVDTTGLLLLTDNGQWLHRITSPKYYCEKTYLVTLELPLSQETVRKFAEGVLLRGEKSLTRSASVDIISDKQVRLRISEGRYHQVKRMFASVGNRVIALHRERVGAIILSETLEEGDYRVLTDAEIDSVNNKDII